MSDEKIIQFPGDKKDAPKNKDVQAAAESLSPMSQAAQGLGMPQLSPDQEKAIQIIMSGMSYVCIGIKDTGEGADFFTAIDGDPDELGNAQTHLQGVIDRAFIRQGV